MEHVVKLLNPYKDPIGFGLYFEPTIGPRTKELELKLLFQKNFLDDRLVTAANLVMETEWERSADNTLERASVLDVLVGASYRFAPNWAAGLEFRNHREFVGNFYQSPEHSAYFLGPNLHYAQENFWVTLGWRHQLPAVEAFSADQQAVVKHGRIYGDEHAKDEFMLRIGFPFGGGGGGRH